MIKSCCTLILALGLAARAEAQAWFPDLGNGRYRNPVIFADYSDPDVIRVGDDFYLTASSFNAVPALPILHSRDLVNWTIVNYAIRRLPATFDTVQHGDGVWAPSLRYHAGWFYIFYGDPDRGIYMVRARNIVGRWEAPVLVQAAKGWIDPSPLWDDDGKAYLVHAFANSRAGVKSILHVNRMSPDGTRLLDDGTLVFDGHAHHPTIEGPKFYKRNGYYYIFAPAGGVPTGWQTVLRSRSVFGPYQDRIVMRQGDTPVNGPHQGGWVELKNGDDWFIHFQDRGPYGRITHLQPLRWVSDWPVIGDDPDGDGVGQPVLEHAKPNVGHAVPHAAPQASDEFARQLGVQWQWQANPQPGWSSLAARPGWLRLFAQPLPSGARNLWPAPNLLLSKLPAPAFVATTKVELSSRDSAMHAGLVILGMDYAYVAVRRTSAGLQVVQARAIDATKNSDESATSVPLATRSASIYLRVTVSDGARCEFAYSETGRDNDFHSIGEPFQAREGRWVGAKLGLFADGPTGSGFADFDYFRLVPPKPE